MSDKKPRSTLQEKLNRILSGTMSSWLLLAGLGCSELSSPQPTEVKPAPLYGVRQVAAPANPASSDALANPASTDQPSSRNVPAKGESPPRVNKKGIVRIVDEDGIERIIVKDVRGTRLEDIHHPRSVKNVGCGNVVWGWPVNYRLVDPAFQAKDWGPDWLRDQVAKDPAGLRQIYPDELMRAIIYAISGLAGIPPRKIHPDEPLQSPNLAMDLVDIGEIVLLLEDTHNISVSEEIFHHLVTPRSLCAHIHERKQLKQAPSQPASQGSNKAR